MGNVTMTLAEKMNFAGETIALGLIVVFVCLVLLIVVITVLSAILKERKKKSAEPETKLEKALKEPLPQSPVVQVQDDELIAVLTAAVAAAMESEQNASPFIIRSYKRTSGATAWNRAGRDSQISNW